VLRRKSLELPGGRTVIGWPAFFFVKAAASHQSIKNLLAEASGQKIEGATAVRLVAPSN